MFGDVLRGLRKETNLTQKELSIILGISESTVGMYERNQREPSFETLEAIADYFNVDMDFLTGRTTVKRAVSLSPSPPSSPALSLTPDEQTLITDYRDASDEIREEAVIRMTTGERMKDRRKQLGLSAEYVAERLGVSPATIYRYEKGDIEKMPGNILEPISKILNTTPSFLMGWDSVPVSPSPPSSPALSLTPDEQTLITDYRDASDEIREEAGAMLHRSAERNRKERVKNSSNAG